MSVILDALKKLDREKSSHRDGTANIVVEILRPDPPSRARRMLRYFAAVSITAAATACITYAVIAGFGIMSKSSPPATVSSPPGQQSATALPLRESVSNSTDRISRATAKIQDSAESKKSAIPPPSKKAGRNIFAKEPDIAPETIKKSAEATPRASATPLPSLKLSGIIWQEEPGERRAMINGRVATEGSMIEGVKVVEIHPTRVRFSHNGRSFEITLGQ
ncbi:MAG: general secretion pathway protein GspB [Syntrophales bacterium]